MFIGNFSFLVFNGTQGKFQLNMTFILLSDLEKHDFIFRLSGKTDESRFGFDASLISSRVDDSCKLCLKVFSNIHEKSEHGRFGQVFQF